MKLLYITNGITGSGGLERVLSVKASMLAEDFGYDVHILTLNESGKPRFYTFSPKIIFHSIKVGGSFLRYLKSFRNGILQTVNEINPDVISVCDDGLKGFFIPKMLGNRIPVIYERHASVNISARENLVSRLKKKVQHLLMKSRVGDFAKFVVLTNGNKQEWGKHHNVVVIPNPVSFYPSARADLSQKKIIAVGSQGYNKGTDLLLKIWSMLENTFPDWQLEIYGKPHPDGIYEKQAKEMRNVHFFPATPDIMEKYLTSSILVLTSRSEGFGMVLIEAMACGLPVVSFDCPHGPGDIISDGQDGFLVENGNLDEFSEKLQKLMRDNAQRTKMGAQAKRTSVQYEAKTIVTKWNRLFKNLISN